MRPLLVSLVVAASGLWGALALWYRAPGNRAARAALCAAWSAFCAVCLAGPWAGWPGAALAAFAAAYLALLFWWRGLRPTHDRDWADDVAQMTCGAVEGDRATLEHVRNFAWRSLEDYTPRWERRTYDLSQLCSLDLVMSYWSRRSIAHVLLSFGFADGTHLVFSVEVRRGKTQTFSEIGGFFKEFELCVIAADERDIVRLRTNMRREQTYLYRLRLERAQMRSLFLCYLAEANELARRPRFYHTLSGNCTILVYRMLRRVIGPLPLSYRLWLSGYLPEYMYGVGRLDMRYPLEELRALGYISERGRIADQSAAYSADIRAGIPPL